MKRAYVFDAKARERIATVKRIAELAGNWYIVGQSACPPGDLPRHMFEVSAMRCVFSITLHEGVAGWQLYRHLSCSLPSESGEAVPQPIVVLTVAHMLGLTGGELEPAPQDEAFPMILGPAKDWQIGVQDGVITVAQLLDPTSMPKPNMDMRKAPIGCEPDLEFAEVAEARIRHAKAAAQRLLDDAKIMTALDESDELEGDNEIILQ